MPLSSREKKIIKLKKQGKNSQCPSLIISVPIVLYWCPTQWTSFKETGPESKEASCPSLKLDFAKKPPAGQSQLSCPEALDLLKGI